MPPLLLLAALYVTQYLGVGFIVVGLTAILRREGLELDALAQVQLIGLVWPLKFLWAPVVDRFGWGRLGHYRGWLLALQTGLVVSLLLLLPYDDPAAHLGAVLTVAGLYVFCSATQDVAADALAVRLLAPAQRGLGNGVQVAATYVGNVIGGGLVVMVYDRWGWDAAILTLAAATAVALLAVIAHREPARSDRPTLGASYRSLGSVLRQPGCSRWALKVVPLYYAGAAGAYALVTPALVDAGWSLTRIALVTSILASLPSVVAGLAGGWLVSRFGERAGFAVGAVALVVGCLALAPLMAGSAPALATTLAVSLFLAAYTVANVAIYAVNMSWSRPATAGSDFTVLTSLAMAVSFLAAWVTMTVAALAGYLPALALAALLVVAGGALAVRAERPTAAARPEASAEENRVLVAAGC